jgi:hypothetical protein
MTPAAVVPKALACNVEPWRSPVWVTLVIFDAPTHTVASARSHVKSSGVTSWLVAVKETCTFFQPLPELSPALAVVAMPRTGIRASPAGAHRCRRMTISDSWNVDVAHRTNEVSARVLGNSLGFGRGDAKRGRRTPRAPAPLTRD